MLCDFTYIEKLDISLPYRQKEGDHAFSANLAHLTNENLLDRMKNVNFAAELYCIQISINTFYLKLHKCHIH